MRFGGIKARQCLPNRLDLTVNCMWVVSIKMVWAFCNGIPFSKSLLFTSSTWSPLLSPAFAALEPFSTCKCIGMKLKYMPMDSRLAIVIEWEYSTLYHLPCQQICHILFHALPLAQNAALRHGKHVIMSPLVFSPKKKIFNHHISSKSKR